MPLRAGGPPRPHAMTRVTCRSNPSPCFPGVECQDTTDGPRCGRCPQGYVGDGKKCKPGRMCDVTPCAPGEPSFGSDQCMVQVLKKNTVFSHNLKLVA